MCVFVICAVYASWIVYICVIIFNWCAHECCTPSRCFLKCVHPCVYLIHVCMLPSLLRTQDRRRHTLACYLMLFVAEVKHAWGTVSLCQHNMALLPFLDLSRHMHTHAICKHTHTHIFEWLKGFAVFSAVKYKLFGCWRINVTKRRDRQVVVKSGTCHVSEPYLSPCC